MKKLFTNLLLFIIVFSITLIISELFIRLTSKYFLQIYDVEMWRYSMIVKKESSWPDVIEEHRVNTAARLMGVRIRTDKAGFRRNIPLVEAERTEEDRRVIVVGDSLTLGWGVPEGKTYADILEKLFKKKPQSSDQGITVLNGGIGNCNTKMQFARYQRYYRQLKPIWVIIGYFINDAEPSRLPNKNFLLQKSCLAALIVGQLKIHFGSHYSDYSTYYKELYKSDQPGWLETQKALKNFAQLMKEDNIPVTVLLLPEMHEPKDFGYFAKQYQQVAQLCQDNGLEVIDASKSFPQGAGNSFWVSPSDAHPNVQAQELFAEALTSSIYFPKVAAHDFQIDKRSLPILY